MTRIERYKHDLAVLEKEYGKFDSGTELTIDLMELSALCPRAYSQIKAYNGLVSFISRTKGATVNITSQLQDGNQTFKNNE